MEKTSHTTELKHSRILKKYLLSAEELQSLNFIKVINTYRSVLQYVRLDESYNMAMYVDDDAGFANSIDTAATRSSRDII